MLRELLHAVRMHAKQCNHNFGALGWPAQLFLKSNLVTHRAPEQQDAVFEFWSIFSSPDKWVHSTMVRWVAPRNLRGT